MIITRIERPQGVRDYIYMVANMAGVIDYIYMVDNREWVYSKNLTNVIMFFSLMVWVLQLSL